MPITRIWQTSCVYCDAYNQDLANKLYKMSVYIAMPITRIWQTSCVYCNAYKQDLANKLYFYCNAYNQDLANKLYVYIAMPTYCITRIRQTSCGGVEGQLGVKLLFDLDSWICASKMTASQTLVATRATNCGSVSRMTTLAATLRCSQEVWLSSRSASATLGRSDSSSARQ